MLKEGSLIKDQEDALYLPAFFHSEVGVARRIKEACGNRLRFYT